MPITFLSIMTQICYQKKKNRGRVTKTREMTIKSSLIIAGDSHFRFDGSPRLPSHVQTFTPIPIYIVTINGSQQLVSLPTFSPES